MLNLSLTQKPSCKEDTTYKLTTDQLVEWIKLMTV